LRRFDEALQARYPGAAAVPASATPPAPQASGGMPTWAWAAIAIAVAAAIYLATKG
jgi:uncharacterized protein